MADRTESSIEVAAPPADVLAVIADFEAYPDWTGDVKSTEVLAAGARGRAQKVRFVLDAGVVKDTYVLDYAWRVAADGTGTVSWSLDAPATVLRSLDGSYELTGPKAGPTTVRYELAVDVKVPMLGLLKRKAEQRIIAGALRELKKRVEG